MFISLLLSATSAGVSEVGGNLPVEAAAARLAGRGDAQAERALPAEDAAQGDAHRTAQPGEPGGSAEARPAGGEAPQVPISEWK